MENIQTNEGQLSVVKVVILGVITIIVLGGLFWYARIYKKPAVGGVLAPSAPSAPSAGAVSPESTLGGQIYSQTTNPIQNKLPDTVAPVPNPIQGAYNNPFQ